METIMETKIEYRVRPVTRYIVTRYEEESTGIAGQPITGASSTQYGEFDSHKEAYNVGYALCLAEHQRLGWPPGDERIRYPDVEA